MFFLPTQAVGDSTNKVGKRGVFLSPFGTLGARYGVYSHAVPTRRWASRRNALLCWCPCLSALGRWCCFERATQRDKSACSVLAWSPASRVSFKGSVFPCAVHHQPSTSKFCCSCARSSPPVAERTEVAEVFVKSEKWRGEVSLVQVWHNPAVKDILERIEVFLRPVVSHSAGACKGATGQTWCSPRDSKWL